MKTGSSLFSKNCRSYFLFTPDGLSDFLDQFELVPLFQLGQLIADLAGGKAALRTQAKTVERNVLLCLADAGDDGILIFQPRRFGSDKTQHHFFAIGHIFQRLKAAGTRMQAIEARGVEVSPKNLKLSDKATISMPWHKVQDGLEEDRLAQKGSAFGSTRRGIAYAYSDKYRKKTLRLGDLLHLDEKRTQNRLHMILDSKNMELAGCYHQEKMSYDALLNWCKLQAEHFTPYICDVGAFLQQAHDSGKRIVLEAQLGAMRDIDYGIFPFTSSSNTLAAYAPLGAGIPNCKLDHVVGVLKSYSTCVGAGPFAAENAMGEEWNEKLRKAGGEYGAATGRPRRIGPFDCVASRYGLACQGADKIALTKLDVLSSMEEIPVITGYKLDGVKVPRFDTLSDLDRMEPVVTMLPGWNKDISGCQSWDELPKEAKGYVEFLEKQLDHEIQFVSTGAEREKFVLKGEWL